FLDGTKFDPDTKRVMGVAFEMAWVALGLTDNDDLNSIVAQRIIELANAGERNPDILCEKALKGLRSRRTPKQFQSTTKARKEALKGPPLTANSKAVSKWCALGRAYNSVRSKKKALPKQGQERSAVSFAERDLWNVGATMTAYSALMLAARITLPHFSVSSAISFPNSAGDNASTVPPKVASLALIFGSASAALISLLSFSMLRAVMQRTSLP